jgi:hypothetical protein
MFSDIPRFCLSYEGCYANRLIMIVEIDVSLLEVSCYIQIKLLSGRFLED